MQMANKVSLDVVMALSVFNLSVSLFFIDYGVFSLIKSKHSLTQEADTLFAHIKTLPLYDIQNIYVCRESLRLHGLTQDHLCLNPITVESIPLNDLIAPFPIVLTF